MKLTAGTRLKSAVCATQVVVVRAPSADASLECGGQPMIAVDDEPSSAVPVDPAHAAGTSVGKRYESEAAGLEVIVTKAGDGSLSLDGVALMPKLAKPLPSSD